MENFNRNFDVEADELKRPSKKLVLINCGSKQDGAPCKAKDLYKGPLYKICFANAKMVYRI